MRNIDNKIYLKNQKQSTKQLNKNKFKSAFHHGVSIDGQQNLTARESQVSNGTMPYNVSYGGARNTHSQQNDQRDSH